MANEIDTLRQALNGDVVRPNLFRVEFFLPKFLAIEEQSISSILIKATSFPESNLNVLPIHLYGRTLSFPGECVFPDWTITCINDQDMVYYNLFDSWQEKINDTLTNKTDMYLQDILGDANVYIYSRTSFNNRPPQLVVDGEPLVDNNAIVRKFKKIWPIKVSELSLSDDKSNEYSTFDVTFKVLGGIEKFPIIS